MPYESGVQQNRNSLANLQAGKNKKWSHTPTQAIRVPAVFAEDLLKVARSMDNDEGVQAIPSSPTHDLEAFAEEALASAVQQGIDPQELVAELQFMDLCGDMDRWPKWLRKQFVAKLVRRYIGK